MFQSCRWKLSVEKVWLLKCHSEIWGNHVNSLYSRCSKLPLCAVTVESQTSVNLFVCWTGSPHNLFFCEWIIRSICAKRRNTRTLKFEQSAGQARISVFFNLEIYHTKIFGLYFFNVLMSHLVYTIRNFD